MYKIPAISRVMFFVLLLSTMTSAEEPESLVTITVKGTKIDKIPVIVELIVADPQKQAEALIAKGGVKGDLENLVVFKGVTYFFDRPTAPEAKEKIKLVEGDVLYTYHVESAAERDEFVKKYGLKAHEEDSRTPPKCYVASPHFYVYVVIPRNGFTCGMHPDVFQTEKGKCPVCGMDLVSVKQYR